MQETQVSFSLNRFSSEVKIFLGNNQIDSISVYKFAKVIEAHDKIANRKNDLTSLTKKYYDFCFLWYGISEKLSAWFYDLVDPAKLEVLDQIKFTFLKPKNKA